MSPTTVLSFATLLFPALPLDGAAEAHPTGGDFAAVRGILETRCLECHGGDHRKSGLSFASAETFAEGGLRGDVLDRDDLRKSRLLEVIEYGNPELAMPKSGALDDAELEVLRRWILEGAPWPTGEAGELADPSAHPLEESHVTVDAAWWAYAPLDAQAPPVACDAAWNAHPVDAWIRAANEAAGFTLAERATPEALLRRATFALTGLPPSPKERHAFLAAVESRGWDAAWSDLLDRLFASPHYGEAQARHWLDLVRYGETDGYERDSPKRNIWRYRDWIIRACNDDLPYDRFVQLQLAGDEYATDMEDPFDAADAQLATGFYRIGLYDDEPADRLQAASDARADIVDTVSQVVFGTTMGCARCHDHKADPVTQKEYFQLTAHFTGVTRYSKEGTRLIPDRAAEGVWAPDVHAARLAELEGAIAAQAEQLGLGGAVNAGTPVVLVPDARESDRGHGWLYRAGDAFAGDDWKDPAFEDSTWKRGRAGFGKPGTPGAVLHTDWITPVIQLRTTFGLEEIPHALRLSYIHDENIKIYLNGQSIFEAEGFTTHYGARQLGAQALGALVVGRNVLAVECTQTIGGQAVDVGLSTAWDVEAEGGLLESLRVALADHNEDKGTASTARLRALLAQRERHLTEPIALPYPAHVAYERGPVPPEQFVEMRGSVHARGDRVEPALPAAWLVGESAPKSGYSPPAASAEDSSSLQRRALADWAFEGGAHVTARVEANRIWQFLFGRGICRSSGDFGRLGERPTHPELLDCVARELIARNWSVKSLQRWLMESRTFQMSTERGSLSVMGDPRNDKLSAFDPRRLTAEEFRDATLAVSGELSPEMFGPWVFPPLAEEVLATSSQPHNAWGKGTPEDAVRRSLYVHVKRSLREPLLAALDQPDPDLPCPVRFPTNVPTQALLTLNGPFVHARAASLAEAVLSGQSDPGAALRTAIGRALGRDATDDEVARGIDFVTKVQAEHDLDETGAMALFALGLFNRNEFLWID